MKCLQVMKTVINDLLPLTFCYSEIAKGHNVPMIE